MDRRVFSPIWHKFDLWSLEVSTELDNRCELQRVKLASTEY